MPDKFGEAIGIWHITLGGSDLELKPAMGDNRKFRKILMENQKNKVGLMDKFEDFMVELIKRDYPEDDENQIKMFVEFNSQGLFEEVMIKFRWTTKDDLEQSKKEALKDLGKLTGES